VFEYARAGRRRDGEQSIDTRTALAELVDYLGPPVDVEIALDPALPTINGDRAPFDQVFRNLLSNAFTYRRAHAARVSVHAVTDREFATFFVVDNGPGIPAAQLPRIWRLFQTSRPGVGTGIGLAVVKRLVEAQGGSIDVDSIEGQGSTFRVRWPLKPARRSA
jgi:signal transduction histidine kinase